MPFKANHFHRSGLEVLLDEYLAAKFYGFYLFLLLLSFLFSYCVLRRRCSWISEAGATLFIGFLGGGALQLLVIEDKQDRFDELEVRSALVSFSGSVLFCVLLPPIIFNSGYCMRGNFFWANIDKITTFAFAGTFVSSLVFGCMFFYAQGPLLNSEPMSLPEALSFGALISAVDPVSTLEVFQELNVDPHLNSIVFGESVLNDAVSIVLFHTFGQCIGYTGPVTDVIMSATWSFAYTFLGSVLVGLACGCCSALLFKHVQLRVHSRSHGPHLELAVFLIFSYIPYLLAECFLLSGTVAILFTGTCMKRYTYCNLSHEAQQFSETMISLVARIAESFIFIDLGTSAWQPFAATPSLVAWVLLACLIARAVHVYPLSAVLNSMPMRYPRRRLEQAEMHMVWFSGLRGAIAYALSTQFPGPHRDRVMSLTMSVVLITVWGMGGATKPVLQRLGIRQMQPGQFLQQTLTLEPFVNRLQLVHWDRKYIRPLLTELPASMSASPFAASGSDGDAEDNREVLSGSARTFNGLQATLVDVRDNGVVTFDGCDMQIREEAEISEGEGFFREFPQAVDGSEEEEVGSTALVEQE